jgi:hypothetical protein
MPKKERGARRIGSDTVSVRMEAKLLFALRLAAAKERRTLSGFIEATVAEAARRIMVAQDEQGEPASAWAVAEQIWEADEAKRLMHLATLYPELLTQHEERLWNLIWYSTAFSRERPKRGGSTLYDPAVYIDWGAVEKHWDTLKAVAAEEEQMSALPKGEPIAESKITAQRGKHG